MQNPAHGTEWNGISLAGAWKVRLDRSHSGERERWHLREFAGAEVIQLPGSLPLAGIGDKPGPDTLWTGSIFDDSLYTDPRYAEYRKPEAFKVPFWLQPDTYYAGRAWYQRSVTIPEEWSGRRLEVTLERPHGFTRVWIGRAELGSCDSLSTPHRYVGEPVPAGSHLLTVLMDNDTRRIDVGENSHSVSDHTQGNWNGIVGALTVRPLPPVRLERIEAHPCLASRSVRIVGELAGEGDALNGEIAVAATLHAAGSHPPEALPASSMRAIDGRFEGVYPLGEYARTWDEHEPSFYHLELRGPCGDVRTTRFGLREVAVSGRTLLMNGRPFQVRGTLECAIFPRTGHPPTDEAEWRRILRVARAHGLNTLRFHSWCPPEAAFVAADEAGFLLQVEVASWPNQSVTVGDDRPVDGWLHAESERIVRAYGNHPSFVFLVLGNEPAGARHERWLADWLRTWKARDSRRLYSAGSGWPNIPQSDFLVDWRPRIQHWGAGLASRVNARPPETATDYRDYIGQFNQPLVSHEVGQWCVYPNLDEIPKYTGYLKPRNFEIFRDRLRASGLLELAPRFLQASGKLQALCYKEEIESALRTPGMAGFHLLDLHDFPGQGTALVGVLDPFWEEKGYIRPAEFRRFCSPTVPLARLRARTFTASEVIEAELELSHWGPVALEGARLRWTLAGRDGLPLATGEVGPRVVPAGSLLHFGSARIPLRELALGEPSHLRLIVGLEGTDVENDWDLWVYPQINDADSAGAAGVVVVRELDPRSLAALQAGATVLAALPRESLAGDVQMGFSSIFWNTSWTKGQAPHTLGILCEPAHPALRGFPTDPWSNWQWAVPIQRGGALDLGRIGRPIEPVVRVIDDWFTARSLAFVLEARVGRGRLLLVGSDLTTATDPASRQLLRSLLRHAATPPAGQLQELHVEEVGMLMKPTEKGS